MLFPEGPFALLRRAGRGHVEVLSGPVTAVATLADIPDRALALVPYRQVRERGFEAVDDGAPLLVLTVDSCVETPIASVLAALPAGAPVVGPGAFDVPDDAYERVVSAVLADEIGRGEGANFVIHRVYEARVEGDPRTAALAAYRRLLTDERGAYWTFLIDTGTSIFVGATPERHVSVHDGKVMMNPISGTYRHPSGGPDRDGLLAFLRDRKEIDELYMVLDEELKMMATVAAQGGQVVGPYLKEMAHLTHTEYLLVGTATRDVRDVLRETMFAPTVVGSPIENACRVVRRREGRGRGYYGGVAALLGRDASGRQTLDAPILIRTAELSRSGTLRIPVGATLVRHSTPAHEVAETYAKAAGVMAALGVSVVGGSGSAVRGSAVRGSAVRGSAAVVGGSGSVVGGSGSVVGGFAADPDVRSELSRRNETLARFWLDPRSASSRRLSGRVLIVDAEDTFTGMLAHQLRALGLTVVVRSHRAGFDASAFDLVVVGPGPGAPDDLADPRIARLHRLVASVLADRRPTLAVCLGHQVLARTLGLPIRRKDTPYQGVQREIDFFGQPERVGFYSTYTAVADRPLAGVELSTDPATGEVHALRGQTYAGVQFHPESVLTEHGVDLLYALVAPLVGELVG